MGQNSAGKRRYITGFDGLRAIAVIGVIVFHLWPNRLTGGWLGVPLFFVLSGYLITDLLIQEYDRNGRIDLIGFYRRRIKRLYPALVVIYFIIYAQLLAAICCTYITFGRRSTVSHISIHGVVLRHLPTYGHYQLKDNSISFGQLSSLSCWRCALSERRCRLQFWLLPRYRRFGWVSCMTQPISIALITGQIHVFSRCCLERPWRLRGPQIG